MDSNLRWAVVLGASSGFGAATARALAARGWDIVGVHLDRRSTLPLAEAVAADVRAAGREARFYNVNAADPGARAQVVGDLAAAGAVGQVGVLLHSLAFGTTSTYLGPDAVNPAQMAMTLDVMAHSLVYWVQDLVAADLLGRGAKIFAMTSSGATRVMPHYGPVSAAKAALESHMRQLALELGPRGIACNCVRAGVTDTPALRKIPGHERLLAAAAARNPGGRLTTPADVAATIALLAEAPVWLTGNVIGVDGGEDIVG